MECSQQTERTDFTTWRFRWEQFKALIRDDFSFYTNLSFLKKELYRLWVCRKKGAFQINVDFFRGSKDPREVNAYGETPLKVMDIIARTAGIFAGDVVYDLGSSHGRTSFFLNEFYKCKVVGIELNTELFSQASQVLAKFHTEGVSFRKANYFEVDYSEATVIYFYSTCVTDIGMRDFAKALHTAKKGTRIVTVSKSLIDIQLNETDGAKTGLSASPKFKLLAKKALPYFCGHTNVYFQEKL